MKKKIAIINVALSLAVLFGMLFQSVHSYEHLAKELSDKHCLHDHKFTAEYTHQHHGAEQCFVCEFTFSSFEVPQIFSLPTFTYHTEVPYFSWIPETPESFSGSVYAHRGPPAEC